MYNAKPCRQAFSTKLLELAQHDSSICVVTSDARGSATLNEFADKLPEQLIEVGIAEQNGIGIAAGLSSTGKRVFVCAPASFLSARSLEQIKIDIVYSRNPVVIVGISGGISYGALGYSHHSLHDLAVFRTFPEFSILLPSDYTQTEAMTQWLIDQNKAVYLRMGRNPVEDIYAKGQECFTFGKANTLREGKDATIIASGETVRIALKTAELLQQEDVTIRVLDMHTIKPLDTDSIIYSAKKTGAIVTIEEHSIFGGLGSSVAEVLSQNYPVPMKILGIPDEFPVTGDSKEIYNHYSLNEEGIRKQIKLLLRRKKVDQ